MASRQRGHCLQVEKQITVYLEGALSSDSPVQGDLRETLNEVTKAAETVRSLADYLERHPESLIRGRREGSDKK